jgi:rhamnosyltransferase
MNSYVCDKEIAILMSAYNGARFLIQQLESLYNQTYNCWNLYIRDDGSADSTLEIIRKYQKKYDNLFIVNDKLHLGPGNSFMKLLEIVDSRYYMFCDQDDVWFPEKIEKTLNSMQALERNNPDMPIVVHTDVSLVDTKLNILAGSYWKTIHLDPNKMKSYNYLAVCCYSTGCTMLFNKKAKEVSVPWDNNLIMHDWWVATRVIKNGIVNSIYDPTMYYRQHEKNIMGVSYGKKNSIFYKLIKLRKVLIDNYNFYKALERMNYGTVFKFICYKFKVILMTRIHK